MMKAMAIAGAVTSSLFVATALTPVHAADMTFERSLNVGKEPQNWLLHHGNYEGYRFSQLKDITKAVAATSSAISRPRRSSRMA
jgi:alcohol dehydrogenase (cytochrome c)